MKVWFPFRALSGTPGTQKAQKGTVGNCRAQNSSEMIGGEVVTGAVNWERRLSRLSGFALMEEQVYYSTAILKF